MRHKATALALIMVVSMVAMAAAPAAATQEAEGEAYSGTHVDFETGGNSVSNYAVNENVIVTNASMQSASEARSEAGVDIGAGVSSMGSISGAEIESSTEARASVTVGFSSGGEMRSNDNNRGVVQFVATDGEQFVQVNVSSDSETRSESDKRLIVEKDDGSQGAFIVVGEGEVDTNSEGQVNAELEEGSELVYRQYEDERSDDDDEAERMIEDGTATAEVYVQESAEDGEETATHAIEYGQDTSVEVVSESESRIEMNVERAESEGKVVLTSVSDAAFDSADDLEVMVDGEAAAQANSYSEVEQSAMDGDEPRYYVAQSSSTEATTDIAVGIDHFSERNVEMENDGDGATDGDGAGFGALAALAALAAGLIAMRRRA